MSIDPPGDHADTPQLASASRMGRASPWLVTACLLLALAHVWWVKAAWAGIPLQTDSGIWAYIGWRLNNGATLYRDLWDNKPPGIFYAFALAERFGEPGSDVPLRWMDAIVTIVVLGLTFALARRLASTLAAAIAVLLLSLVMGHRVLADWGCNAEKFVAVFETASLILIVGAFRHPRAWKWLIVGGLCAAASTFKQTGIVVFFSANLVLFFQKIHTGKSRGRILACLWLGFVMLWIPLLVWMAGKDSLDGFFRQAIFHDLGRASTPGLDAGGIFFLDHWRGVWEQIILAGVIVWPALLALLVISKIRSSNQRSAPLALIVLQALLCVCLFVAAPKGYGHYLLQAAPALAVLAACAIDWGLLRREATLSLGLIIITLLVGSVTLGDHFEFISNPACPARQAYADIASRTNSLVNSVRGKSSPSKSVMVWPTDHAVSYYASRITPLEIGHSIDLFRDNLAILDPPLPELIRYVEAHPPEMIVDWTPARMFDVGGEWQLAVKGPFSLVEPPDPQHEKLEGRLLAPFKHWVRENFGAQEQSGDATLYFYRKPWKEWTQYMQPPFVTID